MRSPTDAPDARRSCSAVRISNRPWASRRVNETACSIELHSVRIARQRLEIAPAEIGRELGGDDALDPLRRSHLDGRANATRVRT